MKISIPEPESFAQLCSYMEGIKNIIFDFGNVLFDLDLSATRRKMKSLLGDKFDAVYDKIRQYKLFELYETGGISTEEFLETIKTASNNQVSESELRDAWNSIFIEFPMHRLEMLQGLRQEYNVFLLSNINAMHEQWIAEYVLREHGIHDYESRFFYCVYFSHLVRLRKPNAAIYEYLIADAEIKPNESVFFDDLPENIETARQLGIHSFVHSPGTEIREHVNEILISMRNVPIRNAK